MAQNSRSTRKINKSAWIRAQNPTLSAKDVVAKAKDQGIDLSVAQVYTARSNAAKSRANGRGSRPGRSPVHQSGSDKDLVELRRLVLAVGFNRAAELFSRIQREFGF